MLDGSLGLVIGDVSGHGLGPAIVMALTYAHLRSLAQVYTDVEEMLARVNRFLTNETDHFVTLLFGRLTPGTRSFVGVNAGHPPGYVLDGAGRIKARIESKSVPLAVLPDATFPTSDSVTLAAGDMVLLLTDGILKAQSARERPSEPSGCWRSSPPIASDRPAKSSRPSTAGSVNSAGPTGQPTTSRPSWSKWAPKRTPARKPVERAAPRLFQASIEP